MNNDDNMDLLDLDTDDTASMDSLPDAAPFAAPRPKKPWLLLGIGLVVIILATYIIIRTIGGDSSSSIEVDLDAPAVVVEGAGVPVVDVNTPPTPVETVPAAPLQPAQPVVQPVPQPAAQPQPKPQPVVQETAGVPVRVVEDRKEVTFNPDKPAPKKQVAQPKKATPKAQPVKKAAPKPQVAPKGSWYVQFGSYSTRALAESAQRQIQSGHKSLFEGKQFVILAAVLPNGTTTYRLRIAFATSAAANGFCQNAKSDGLDCYVAK